MLHAARVPGFGTMQWAHGTRPDPEGMQTQRHESPHRQSLIRVRAFLTTFRDLGLGKPPKTLMQPSQVLIG